MYISFSKHLYAPLDDVVYTGIFAAIFIFLINVVSSMATTQLQYYNYKTHYNNV